MCIRRDRVGGAWWQTRRGGGRGRKRRKRRICWKLRRRFWRGETRWCRNDESALPMTHTTESSSSSLLAVACQTIWDRQVKWERSEIRERERELFVRKTKGQSSKIMWTKTRKGWLKGVHLKKSLLYCFMISFVSFFLSILWFPLFHNAQCLLFV